MVRPFNRCPAANAAVILIGISGAQLQPDIRPTSTHSTAKIAKDAKDAKKGYRALASRSLSVAPFLTFARLSPFSASLASWR